jgi:hypothetical protein
MNRKDSNGWLKEMSLQYQDRRTNAKEVRKAEKTLAEVEVELTELEKQVTYPEHSLHIWKRLCENQLIC